MSEIKFKDRTLDLLKNFSQINQSMVFHPGRNISTLSQGRKILARAKIEETIGESFAIYELSRFFQALSIFKEPTVEIDDKFIVISDGKRVLRYITAEADNIVAPSEEAMRELPSIDVSFLITEKVIKDCLKAASVLGHPDIVLEGDGEKVTMSTQNVDKPTHESYSEDVGDFMGGKAPFKIIMKVENLKLFPGDYTVKICFKKIVQFVGEDVSYIVAAESKSVVPNAV